MFTLADALKATGVADATDKKLAIQLAFGKNTHSSYRNSASFLSIDGIAYRQGLEPGTTLLAATLFQIIFASASRGFELRAS